MKQIANRKSLLVTLTSKGMVLGVQRTILEVANRASAYYQFDLITELLPFLRNSQDSTIRLRASYFEALVRAFASEDTRRRGKVELQALALYADPEIRARSLLSLGALAFNEQDYGASRKLYHEAASIAAGGNTLILARALKYKATVAAVSGYHSEALRALESIGKMAIHLARIDSLFYFDWLNSYSLELGEVGRFDEALGAARIVAASPASRIMPSWGQSYGEIEVRRAIGRHSRGKKVELTPPSPLKPEDTTSSDGIVDARISQPVLAFRTKAQDAVYFEDRDRLFNAATQPNIDHERVRLATDILNPSSISREGVANLRLVADGSMNREWHEVQDAAVDNEPAGDVEAGSLR